MLVADISTAYVLGMQNWNWTDPHSYVETIATCKVGRSTAWPTYSAPDVAPLHSSPSFSSLRVHLAQHFFAYGDSIYDNRVSISQTDVEQTYQVAFKSCITRGHARSLMCAYSTVNGYQMCSHPDLQRVLRDQWHFSGFICSDAGAVGLIPAPNNTLKAATALRAGVDQDLDGGEYSGLPAALRQGLIAEADLDRALTRVFSERVRTGQMDPPELVPYSQYNLSSVDLPASRRLARRAAREGTVLLKNEGGLLPLNLSSPLLTHLAVIGPNADRLYTLLGNYDGCTEGDGQNPPISEGCVLVTPLAAINESVAAANRHRQAALSVSFERGVDINSTDASGIAAAVARVRAADVAVVVLGITTCSGGFGKVPVDCIEGEALDRKTLQIAGLQPQLLRALIATGTPLVLVTMSGSPLALNEWVLAPSVLAVLQHWYSGEEGGHGLTDLLFGAESPSGRLPVTFPLDESQIPFDGNYSMTAAPGRSYRYSTVVPLFSFGYGLSYTAFEYSLQGSPQEPLLRPVHFAPNPSTINASVALRFRLDNVGSYEAAETVQVYVTYTPLKAPTAVQSIPRTELKAFERVTLAAGKGQAVEMRLPLSELQLVGADGTMGLQPGVYEIHVGGASPGSRGMYVDGEEQHGRVVRQRNPQWTGEEVGACQEVQRWVGREGRGRGGNGGGGGGAGHCRWAGGRVEHLLKTRRGGVDQEDGCGAQRGVSALPSAVWKRSVAGVGRRVGIERR